MAEPAAETSAAPATPSAPSPQGSPPAGTTVAGAAPSAAAPAPETLLTDAAAKPAEAKPAEGEQKPAEPAKPAEPVAVEYKDFALPEGVKADDPVLKSFQEHAGKLGVSQEAAQKIVAEVAKHIAAEATKPVQLWAETRQQWQAEVKADKELGGANFDLMRQSVGAALDVYVGALNSPERKAFNEALVATGAGDNPHIVRAFARMAKALSEGTPVAGNPATGAAAKAQQRLNTLYPSTVKAA